LMESATEPLNAVIDTFAFGAPRLPVATNVTGDLVDDPEELRAMLKRHVVSPVRWERSVRTLQQAGAEMFVEAGPGNVLTKLAKRAVPGARAVAVGTPEEAETVASSLS
jgi:[acyl-carrier-protein] S-malonyltransferase